MAAREAESDRVGRALAAETAARTAVLANPRDQRAQQALCELLVRQERLEEAATALRKAIAWLPDLPSLRIQLAFMLAKLGQHAEARAALSHAADQLPVDSDMRRDVIETAGGLNRWTDPPVAAAFPHPQPLLGTEPSRAVTAAGGWVLELDDLAPMATAALVRAGQAEIEPSADQEEAVLLQPAGEEAWGVLPEQRVKLHTAWRIACAVAGLAIVGLIASYVVSRRIERVNRPAPITHRAVPTLPEVKPAAAAHAVLTRPALQPAAPFSTQPKTPPATATGFALPDAALPLIHLAYAPSDANRAQALAAQLRATGALVADLAPGSAAGSTSGSAPDQAAPPGISYAFEEDRPAAETLLRRLGDRFGPLTLRPPSAGSMPAPGSIGVTLPPP